MLLGFFILAYMTKSFPYQLICSDIDGTLLDKNRDISKETQEAFAQLNNEIPIVLASSRMPSAMYYIQEKLGIVDAPLIAYNGGLILGERGQVLQTNTIPIIVLEAVLLHQERSSYNISSYCDDDWHTAEEDYWTLREINNTRVKPTLIPLKNLVKKLKDLEQLPHKIMCMGDENEIDSLVETLAQSYSEVINLYRSKNTYLEITAKNIDKSIALQFLLQEHYKLSMDQVLAFGDNHNDEEMLKHAGMGVAVANATDNVKAVSAYISTLTNKQHAVADAINHFFK